MSDRERTWETLRADLARRVSAAEAMGGADRLAARSAEGRLSARARIGHLVDDIDTFTEIGRLAGDGDSTGFVAGVGRIDDRHVAVGAEDFTVAGGSIGPGEAAKRQRVAELAVQERIPLVLLLEGAGHRPADPAAPAAPRAPGDLMALADASGRVPVAAAVLGVSAGHGALGAPLADYAVMTPDAAIFAAGPPLVKASLGEDVTKESLGGPAVAIASGLIHDLADSETIALDRIRTWLGYLPSSAWEPPPRLPPAGCAEPRRSVVDIVPANPRLPYDMVELIEAVVDPASWYEVQAGFGRSMVTGFARLGGFTVAVVANQPLHLAGAIDAAAADKAAHFVGVADCFHVPLLFLTDNPGVLAGTAAERAGILRHAGRLFAVQHGATVPKVQLTVRKAYGFGSTVMGMNPFDHQTMNLAWPGVTFGAMPARGGDDAVGADDDRRAGMIRAEIESGYRSARNLSVDDVIDPETTRDALTRAFELCAARARPTGPKRATAVFR